MPCLNEAKTLGICIEKAKRYLDESGVVGEVVVADNGSTDGSVQIAKELGARVLHVQVPGYGAALSAGIHEAEGEFVIMGDSDDSYDFLKLQPFVDKLREGFDLVMGNRFLGGISPGAMPFMHRFVGNPLLTAIGRRIYANDVCGDFYCGLRGFRKKAIEDLRVQSTGMEFAIEMIIKAELYRLKIAEVPTTLAKDGRDRKPHLRTYRDGWRTLRLYLLMSPRWTFGIPGLLSMGLGGALYGVSFVGWIPLDWILATLIFSAAAVILGYQAILLAIFAKFIAIEVGLHPPMTRFWMLRDRGTLEKFLIFGGGLTVASLLFNLVAIGHLSDSGLAVGEFVERLHYAGIAGIGLVLGGMTIVGGFYFGILHLISERRQFPRKRRTDGFPSVGSPGDARKGPSTL